MITLIRGKFPERNMPQMCLGTGRRRRLAIRPQRARALEGGSTGKSIEVGRGLRAA
ncbi:hypothetical protein KI387_022015, partial [Taxus chinensis]